MKRLTRHGARARRGVLERHDRINDTALADAPAVEPPASSRPPSDGPEVAPRGRLAGAATDVVDPGTMHLRWKAWTGSRPHRLPTR